MSSSQSRDAADVPDTRIQRAEQVCDRFEAAWKAGARPCLEDHLADVPEPERAALLPELIALEIDYRRLAGEQPGADEFLGRFPTLDRAWVAAVLAEMARPGGSDRLPPPPPTSLARRAPEEGGDGTAVQAAAFPFLEPAEAADELGRLGPYRVLELVGQGGMGVVFRAVDTALGRAVALKVMRPALLADEAARQRFLREARAAAAVEHDHLIPIFQVGEARGVPFFAMPLLRGESLQARLRRGTTLTPAEAVRIGRETAEGLAAAHTAGLIHRDVKPANIWLESRPAGPPRVRLLDFGLARPVAASERLTHSGAVLGTPAYMAPEQARGREVDHRGDLFSLGCVLYRLCTGTLPFPGDDTIAVLAALARDEPVPPHALNPELPPALSELVMRLLNKDPSQRPASAAEVVDVLRDLEKQLTGPKEPDPGGERREQGRSFFTRHSLLVGAAAAGAVALLLAGILLFRQTGNGKVPVVQDGKAIGEKDGEAWLKQVAELPPDKQVEAVAARLKERNPGFDGKVTPLIQGGVVKELHFMTDKVKDVSPVAALTGLQVLRCPGSGPGKGQVADLSPLVGLPLTGLDCACTKVTDLSPLKDMKLAALGCGSTPVSDLTPLRGMPLTALFCGNSQVADLTPLRGMPLLRLGCDHTQVSDLAPLKGMRLTELWCPSKTARDAEFLRALKTLEQINGQPAREFWKAAGDNEPDKQP
jgi:serine/threonine protein kinase